MKKVKCPQCKQMISSKYMNYHLKMKHPTIGQQISKTNKKAKPYFIMGVEATPAPSVNTIEKLVIHISNKRQLLAEQITTIDSLLRIIDEFKS